MVFLTGRDEHKLIVILDMGDVQQMLGGRKISVPEESMRDKSYTSVSVYCFKTAADIEAFFQSVGMDIHGGKHAPTPPGQIACESCKVVDGPDCILDGKCVACWREMARKIQAGAN